MDSSIKNIAILISTLLKGGAEMQAVQLSLTLSTKYNVWLVVSKGDKVQPELLNRLEGSDVNLVRMSGGKIRCVIEFTRVIKQNKIDCIYSYLVRSNLYAGIIGRICCVKYIIGGIRSSLFPEKHILYIERFLHNNVMNLSISNNYCALKNLTPHGFKRDKFRVIHNVFPKPITKVTKLKQDALRIISVGRFVEAKDYKTSLEAIALLRTSHPELNFKYLIIGHGVLEGQIREWVISMDLCGIVEIKVNPNNIYEYLANSDIYLSTSLYEGTSNSILEAMYAQLPIVATNVGDNSYMVTAGNGYLTKIKDIEHISNSLYALLTDTEKMKNMGVESKRIVLLKFGQEAFAQNNFDLLNELIINNK